MHLYKTIFLTSFGGGSDRPLRTAATRIIVAATAAASVGWALSRGFRSWIPDTAGRAPWLAISLMLLVQVTVLITLLAGSKAASLHGTIPRLLLLWPLTSLERYVAFFLPSMLLVTLTLLLIGMPALQLFGALGVHPLLMGLALCVGMVSGFGLRYGNIGKPIWHQCLLSAILLAGEYFLARYTGNPEHAILVRIMAGAVIVALVCITLGQLIRSIRSLPQTIAQIRPTRNVWQHWPSGAWAVATAFRTPHVRFDLITAGLIGSLLAIMGTWLRVLDAPASMFFATILAASVAAGLRSVARATVPPEIAGLRGTLFFVIAECVTAMLICPLVVLPLVITGLRDGLEVGLQLPVGIAAGLFAGTLFAYSARDVLGQFLATLLCALLLLLLPALPFWQPHSSLHTGLYQVWLSVLLMIAMYGIEYKRNTFIWRPDDTKR